MEDLSMNTKNRTYITLLAVVAAASMLLAATPSALRAESGVSDPGAFGILVDPNAAGTKHSSFVSFAYDYETGTARAQECTSTRWVKNLHVVATVTRGGISQVFSSNYSFAGFDNLQACWEVDANQLFFFKYFIERVVIAGLYNCVPGGCPPYAVKAVKNFISTGVGGASLEVELAVK
jgi:hypothetical protein